MKNFDTISEIMLSTKNTWLEASIADSSMKKIVNNNTKGTQKSVVEASAQKKGSLNLNFR
ncbi:unnamed protein product [Sphenostylis stenocarpa]|uniref:Uncharacterized protein n=1 Tax=Sphenostylis stenocarpa TaxID=92480 RepID=A0AA86SPD7_9FABA|nr:unnamed protein product [Sphenostylis stenocarpa]